MADKCAVSKYAIVYKAMNGVPAPYPVTVSYGLVRSFESQRAAYLYAKEIFGSSYEKMGAKIVSMPDALKYIAVHCEVRSGYYVPNGRGGFSINKTRKRYRELYQGFVDGYSREVRLRREAATRLHRRLVAKRAARINAARINAVKADSQTNVAAANVAAGNVAAGNVAAGKGKRNESMTDKELRLAMYQETGRYYAKGVQVKSLGDIEL